MPQLGPEQDSHMRLVTDEDAEDRVGRAACTAWTIMLSAPWPPRLKPTRRAVEYSPSPLRRT